MRLVFLALTSFLMSLTAHATELSLIPVNARLNPDLNYQIGSPKCVLNTNLILDTSLIAGDFAVLEGQFDGLCTNLVSPFTKFFLNLNTVSVSCGSITRTGHYYENGFRVDVSIVDHRTRLCDDMVPAAIIVTREYTSSGDVEVLYSFEIGMI